MIRIPVERLNLPQYKDEDVIKSWEWMMSFISDRDWQKRKALIEEKLAVVFSTSKPFSIPLNEGTLLVIKDDVIGWYLYLVDMLINEPHKYEFFQGARIIPIFKRLGADLNTLKNIDGIDIRVKDLLKKRISEADALLFEILTALLWAKNGYKVAFLPEKHDEKTPDFIAERDGRTWYIECKRQSKTSDYAYKETEKRQKMVSLISRSLLERNILLNIVFHVELVSLPDAFLRDLLDFKLKLAIPGKIVSDDKVDIDLSFIDIPAINEHLQYYYVKNQSPMLNKLIGKNPIDNKGFSCGLYANFYRVGKGEVNNLYVSDISNAYGVYCTCDAEDALWAKARDIKNQLFKAMQQFNSRDTAVIHVGLETLDGPLVEYTRLEKIKQTIGNINPEKTELRWIFCHFFQAYSTPEEYWVFDETVLPISPYIHPYLPLHFLSLIVPEDSDNVEGVSHWDRPLP